MKTIICILITGWIFVSTNSQSYFVESSHYIFPEFTEGVILMKTGKRNQRLINYNSLTEQMIFETNGQKMAIANNEVRLVDTVFIEGRKFVGLGSKFIELVYQSDWKLYIEHKCKMEEPGTNTGYGGTTQTSAASSQASYYTQGSMVWDLELPDGFKAKPYMIYWLNIEGELHQFIDLRQIKKFFADKKDLIKQYSKSNRVRFHDPASIIQLIGFLEAN